jgi:hypothetical protein
VSTWIDNQPECIRCEGASAIDPLGYCGHCHWAVRAEIEDGLQRLCEYLTKWARFDDWRSKREPPS